MTLTEFLLARIDEDEQRAAAAGHGCGYIHEHNGGWVEVDLPDEHNARPSYEMHFIRHSSPARVLAECKAKRRIVETHEDAWGRNIFTRWGQHMQGGTRFALRCLALPYADHPDYDPDWRP